MKEEDENGDEGDGRGQGKEARSVTRGRRQKGRQQGDERKQRREGGGLSDAERAHIVRGNTDTRDESTANEACVDRGISSNHLVGSAHIGNRQHTKSIADEGRLCGRPLIRSICGDLPERLPSGIPQSARVFLDEGDVSVV